MVILFTTAFASVLLFPLFGKCRTAFSNLLFRDALFVKYKLLGNLCLIFGGCCLEMILGWRFVCLLLSGQEALCPPGLQRSLGVADLVLEWVLVSEYALVKEQIFCHGNQILNFLYLPEVAFPANLLLCLPCYQQSFVTCPFQHMPKPLTAHPGLFFPLVNYVRPFLRRRVGLLCHTIPRDPPWSASESRTGIQ